MCDNGCSLPKLVTSKVEEYEQWVLVVDKFTDEIRDIMATPSIFYKMRLLKCCDGCVSLQKYDDMMRLFFSDSVVLKLLLQGGAVLTGQGSETWNYFVNFSKLTLEKTVAALLTSLPARQKHNDVAVVVKLLHAIKSCKSSGVDNFGDKQAVFMPAELTDHSDLILPLFMPEGCDADELDKALSADIPGFHNDMDAPINVDEEQRPLVKMMACTNGQMLVQAARDNFKKRQHEVLFCQLMDKAAVLFENLDNTAAHLMSDAEDYIAGIAALAEQLRSIKKSTAMSETFKEFQCKLNETTVERVRRALGYHFGQVLQHLGADDQELGALMEAAQAFDCLGYIDKHCKDFKSEYVKDKDLLQNVCDMLEWSRVHNWNPNAPISTEQRKVWTEFQKSQQLFSALGIHGKQFQGFREAVLDKFDKWLVDTQKDRLKDVRDMNVRIWNMCVRHLEQHDYQKGNGFSAEDEVEGELRNLKAKMLVTTMDPAVYISLENIRQAMAALREMLVTRTTMNGTALVFQRSLKAGISKDLPGMKKDLDSVHGIHPTPRNKECANLVETLS